MIAITRSFGIDVGHRLLKHESKCKNVHGHRYKIDVTLRAPKLDEVGRILDFGDIKTRIGGWLDAEWDHGFLAEEGDPIIPWLVENKMKHRVLAFPPTAERLVEYLATFALPEVLRGTGCQIVTVRLDETPNCSATYDITQ